MELSIFEKIKLAYSRKKKLLVMGDSHTYFFKLPAFKHAFKNQYNIYLETVGGATISGLANPNSKTNAQAIFNKTHQQIKPDVLIVQLGEVDVGFVLWYRALKYQASITDMLRQCIDNYSQFLTKYTGKEKTIIISAPLPTIKDDQDWGEIANLRKEIKSSQLERTELTLLFNAQMQAIAEKKGLVYINLDKDSMGDNGRIADYLLNDDPNDHHYSPKTYLPLLIKHLKTTL